MHNFIVDLLFDALGKKVSKEELFKQTMDSKLPGFDFASTVLITRKDLSFESIKKALEKNKSVEKVELVNGFINIKLDVASFLNKPVKVKKENKKVMIEFCSPNTNKPLHLGHVRNTLLGNSLSNLLSEKFHVIRANLLNDRGIHICKSMIGYEKFSKFKSPEEAKKKPDTFVGDCYVLFCNALKSNPALEQEAEALLQKWEAGDKEALALWKKMNAWVLQGIKETYKELGVKYDAWFFESEFYNKGKDIILEAYKKGKVKLEDGLGYVVKYGDNDWDLKVVLRQDGTSIYITQDIYLAILKTDKYKLDKSIHVVGNEQDDYFDKLKKVLTVLGYGKIADKIEHYTYGMISLPSGKMKSREGNTVDADDLIKSVRNESLMILKEKNPDKTEKQLEPESKIISDAALKYFILKYDAKKNFIFDIKTSLSFEGNSGPYMLYTYARICSLLENMKKTYKKMKPAKTITKILTPEEQNLASLMLKFEDRLNESIEKESVHFLANYIAELANSFNSLYANTKLTTTEKECSLRFPLYKKLQATFEEIFKILGIEKLKKM